MGVRATSGAPSVASSSYVASSLHFVLAISEPWDFLSPLFLGPAFPNAGLVLFFDILMGGSR